MLAKAMSGPPPWISHHNHKKYHAASALRKRAGYGLGGGRYRRLLNPLGLLWFADSL